MESQVYEHPKVGICIPTTGLIRAATSFSTNQLIGNFGHQDFWRLCWPESKTRAMTMFMREGSGVGPNRQTMVMEALASDPPCTHILFVDEDMEFEPSDFVSLAQRRMPIVGVNYRMRFPPAHFTAVHLDRERGRMETNAQSTGCEPVDYMGFGFCLIDIRVFKALEKPWFLARYIDGEYTTEDLPFFWAARDKGYVAFVDQDASKHIKHLGLEKYSWDKHYGPPPSQEEAKDRPQPVLSAVPSPVADQGRYPPQPAAVVGAG